MKDASYTVSYNLPANWRNIILSKWMRSLRFGNDYYKLMDKDAYYGAYHPYIEKIINDPESCIKFATLSEDEDVVLGFSVSRDNVLHYVHVHKDVRKQGIGRSLVPDGIEVITHLTKNGLVIWSNKCPRWKFNPFAF